MKIRATITLIILFSTQLLLLCSSQVVNPVFAVDGGSEVVDQLIEEIITAIDMDNIITHVRYFSSLSRTTGYPGAAQAAEYIYNYFNDALDLRSWVEEYKVAVPVDHGSKLTVLQPFQQSINAYALAPNNLQTCKTPVGGLEGALTYVGTGSLDELKGSISGSILLMEFNSGDNWLNAMRLGAKAVVFIEPSVTIRSEADRKHLDTPVKFPRLYISAEDGENLKTRLLGGETVTVRIEVDMTWENVVAQNIIAVVNGTETGEEKNNAIVVSAYYDSASVVPLLASGADEANGIASLLELARILKEHPPRRPVWLIAFSGHTQAMAGGRDFIWHSRQVVGQEADGSPKYFTWHFDHVGKTSDVTVAPQALKLAFSLDFSTDSDALALTPGSTYYGVGGPWMTWYDYSPGTLVRFLLTGERYGQYPYQAGVPLGFYYIGSTALRERLGSSFHGLTYKAFGLGLDERYLPSSVTHEASIFAQTGTWGVGFYTAMASRLLYNTPINTFDKVNFGNLAPQVELAFILIRAATNDIEYFDFKKAAVSSVQFSAAAFFNHVNRDDSGLGFGVVKGQIGRWDIKKNWYVSNWEDALGKDGQILVHVKLLARADVYGHSFIQFAEPDGSFTVKGVLPSLGWAAQQAIYQMLPFVVNHTTGDIEYAPDFGPFGTRLWPFGYSFFTFEKDLIDGSGARIVYLSMFKAGTIAIHDLIDPRSILTPVGGGSLKVINHESGVEPTSFSYFVADPPSFEGTGRVFLGDPTSGYDAVVFVPGDSAVRIIFLGGVDAYPIGILTNSERGIAAGSGKYVDIAPTALLLARDLLYITEERINQMRAQRIIAGPSAAEEAYEKARGFLGLADDSLSRFEFGKYYTYILKAWYYARNSYVQTRDLIVDSINTFVFFFALMLPFTFLIDRIAIHLEGRKRILSLVASFTITIFILYLLHPGFRLAANAGMAAVSLATFMLAAPVPLIMFNDIVNVVKEIRRRLIGPHFMEIARVGTAFTAFSLGVENLRRRRFRTALTLISIILVVFSLTSFTSTSSLWAIQKSPPPLQPLAAWNPLYTGILITRTSNFAPINPQLIGVLRTFYGEQATIAPRAFIRVANRFIFNATGGLGRISGILGFTPEEFEVLKLQNVIYQDVGVPWFREGDVYTCFLGEDVAEALAASPGDWVSLFGVNLRVLGVISQNAMREVYDIDGQQITPFDPNIPVPPVPRAFWGLVFIPYELALSLGGSTVSVGLSFKGSVDLDAVASDLCDYLSLYAHSVYASKGLQASQCFIYTPRVLFSVTGWQYTLIPFIVTAFLILNVMLGTIHERIRDISVYSAVGLSPSQVSGMFFAESIVYAILGTSMGYILGLVTSTVLGGIIPGISTNYASSAIVSALTLSIAAVLVSSVYPVFRASRAVTPSLERAWKIPTKPKGVEWNVPLPFSVEEAEVKGILVYVMEFIQRYGSEAVSFQASNLRLDEKVEDGRRTYRLKVDVRLKPYEMGVMEEVDLMAVGKPGETKFSFNLYGKLATGPRQLWLVGHRSFVDVVRKQILLWRSLRPQDREAYLEKGRSWV